MRRKLDFVILFSAGIILAYAALRAGDWIQLKMMPGLVMDLRNPLYDLPTIVLAAFGMAIAVTAFGALSEHMPHAYSPYGIWRGTRTAFVFFIDALCFAFALGLLFTPSTHGPISTANLTGIMIFTNIFPMIFAARELSSELHRARLRKKIRTEKVVG